MSDADLDRVEGSEVLQEAERFLRRMRFSTVRGDFARGEHVVVLVDPRFEDENQSVRVLVTCRALGHRQVDWGRLTVWVEHPQGRCVMAPPLNTRGQTYLPPLPPGEYSLCAGSYFVTRLERKQFASGEVVYSGQARAGDEGSLGNEQVVRQAVAYRSADGRVAVGLRPLHRGIEIAFETRDPRLAGGQVTFAFVAVETGEVALAGKVTLAAVPDAPDVWEGIWAGEPDFSQPCNLVLQVVPADLPDEA